MQETENQHQKDHQRDHQRGGRTAGDKKSSNNKCEVTSFLAQEEKKMVAEKLLKIWRKLQSWFQHLETCTTADFLVLRNLVYKISDTDIFKMYIRFLRLTIKDFEELLHLWKECLKAFIAIYNPKLSTWLQHLGKYVTLDFLVLKKSKCVRKYFKRKKIRSNAYFKI